MIALASLPDIPTPPTQAISRKWYYSAFLSTATISAFGFVVTRLARLRAASADPFHPVGGRVEPALRDMKRFERSEPSTPDVVIRPKSLIRIFEQFYRKLSTMRGPCGEVVLACLAIEDRPRGR